MKTFKQFQEGIFDFLPKGKTLNRGTGGSLTNQEKQRYKMPIKPATFPKPDPYKVTEV